MKKLNSAAIFILLFFIIFIASPIFAGENIKPDFEAVKTDTAPVVDGDIDEEVWKKASKLEQFISEVTEDKAKEQTCVYVLYDENCIYFAFECFVENKNRIVAQQTIRDPDMSSDDWVCVKINTFGDGEGSYQFKVNPLATQCDASSYDSNWNAEWKSAAKIKDDRWIVEIAIPFKSIKYCSSEVQHWQINFLRNNIRNFDLSYWSLKSRINSYYPKYYPYMRNIKIKALSAKPKPKFIGYVVGKKEPEVKPKFNAGIDVCYPLTNSLTANLTLYPDYSNVEADELTACPQQYERYLPETRPFFKEGMSYFCEELGNGFSGSPSYFYTRRIGQFDWGAKVSGKIGRTDIGAMNVYESDGDTSRVVKVKQCFGKNAFVDGDFTEHVSGGQKIRTGLAEGLLFLSDKMLLAGTLSKSGAQPFGNTYSFVAAKYTNRYCLFYASYIDLGANYDLPLGYVPVQDLKGMFYFGNYLRSYTHGAVKELYLEGAHHNFKDHSGKDHYKYINFYGSTIFRHKDIKVKYEYHDDWMYDLHSKSHYIGIGYNVIDWKRTTASIAFGTFENYPYKAYSFNTALLPFKKLKTYYNFTSADFTQDGQKQYNVYHRLDFFYEFNPKTTLSFNVRMNQDNQVNIFAVFRKRLGIDSDMYLVIGDPNDIQTQQRVVFKISFPLAK